MFGHFITSLAIATTTAPAESDTSDKAAIEEAAAEGAALAAEAVEKVLKSSEIHSNRLKFCRAISSMSGDWIEALDRKIANGVEFGDRFETIKLCGFFLEGQFFEIEKSLDENSAEIQQ